LLPKPIRPLMLVLEPRSSSFFFPERTSVSHLILRSRTWLIVPMMASGKLASTASFGGGADGEGFGAAAALVAGCAGAGSATGAGGEAWRPAAASVALVLSAVLCRARNSAGCGGQRVVWIQSSAPGIHHNQCRLDADCMTASHLVHTQSYCFMNIGIKYIPVHILHRHTFGRSGGLASIASGSSLDSYGFILIPMDLYEFL
jgi:hypothetical protein